MLSDSEELLLALSGRLSPVGVRGQDTNPLHRSRQRGGRTSDEELESGGERVKGDEEFVGGSGGRTRAQLTLVRL